MKFTIERDKFQKALQRVNINGNRTMLPLLSNVLLKAENGKLMVEATDLEIRLSTSLDSQVIESGSTTLPIKRLSALVGCFSASEIEFDIDENDHAHITCGTGNFTLRGMAAINFPEAPEFVAIRSFNMRAGDFKRMLNQVSYAVSVDDSRKALTGVLVNIQESLLTLVATDSRRMALQECNPENATGDGSAIVPLQAVNETKRLLEGDNLATVEFSEKQFHVVGPNFELYSKLISENYPTFRKVIPESYLKTVEVPTSILLAKIGMISQIITDGNNFIVLKFENNRLILQATSSEIGEGNDYLDVEYDGEPFAVSFNPKFIADPLKNTDASMVRFGLNDPLCPVAIEAGKGSLYVIMPIRKKQS